MRAAAIQLNSGNDKASNLERAGGPGRSGRQPTGADLIALPEKWNLLGDRRRTRGGRRGTRRRPVDRRRARLGARARRQRARRQHRRDRRWRGAHLQHLVPDRSLRRDRRRPTARSTCSTSRSAAFATRSRRASSPARRSSAPTSTASSSGMTICYDLRFCELYRILAVGGARIFSIPSAFTLATGRDHWEVLLRARAIENAAFVDRAEPVRRDAASLQLLRPLGDRRPLGRGARAGARRASASSPPTSISTRRSECASRCPRLPTAVPRPIAGPIRSRRRADG